MKYELPYGKGTVSIQLDETNVLAVLLPNEAGAGPTGAEEVERALRHPIGARPLAETVRPGERVCIITSDITRPVPSWEILPPLLRELFGAGVKPGDVCVVFGLGSHRGHTEAEMRKLVGDRVFETVRCMDHDPRRFVHLGVTQKGTPVDIFEDVVWADRRICLGNIEYHYFAGYSGGAKAVMPGVSTRAAIQANHSRMVEAEAMAGKMEGNPVREDIEEAVGYVPVDFIVNVVLDEHKHILKAFAGHHMQAHREGCAYLDTLYKKQIPQKADLVIVSAGGYPKDINLYQAQKALDNARHAVKKGGVILLLGECREGLGEGVFEEWMRNARSPGELIDRIQRDFRLGGHKAAAIATVLRDAEVYLVSGLDEGLARMSFLTPFSQAQYAVDRAFEKLGQNAKVILMPYGGATLPNDQSPIKSSQLCRS